MNEEQKNIETCLPEDVLLEVANVPTDPQFRSLVEESFDPLQQQALRQAGCDPYKAKMYHQPYTFTSQVKQMKSNLILLLRRLWRFPFGRGTIRSLADMWQHYITRLKGNPEYGIPSRLSSLTDLPDAPALLADRKIDVAGSSQFPDGVSMPMAMISADVADNVYCLIDTSTNPWTAFDTIRYYNLKKLVLNCDIIDYRYGIPSGISTSYIPTIVEELELPELVNINNKISFESNNSVCSILLYKSKVRELRLPKFSSITIPNYYCSIATNCNELQILDLPSLVTTYSWGRMSTFIARNCPNLRFLRIKGTTDSYGGTIETTPSLIHFEIIDELNTNVNIGSWNPTMALRTDTDAEDYVDLREDMTLANNLQQFLQNFRDYIANRLTDNGKGLTINLSQEVRNAIHAAEAEYGIENIIITQKGWTISPAPN